mgnify:CR=1 FL=1
MPICRFKVAPLLSEEEVRHWILPRQGVVNAYVTVDEVSSDADKKLKEPLLTFPSFTIHHSPPFSLRLAMLTILALSTIFLLL